MASINGVNQQNSNIRRSSVPSNSDTHVHTIHTVEREEPYPLDISANLVNRVTYATPEHSDVVPTYELTRAQKTFSTNANIPNLPKPKTNYFVYFHLNPDLANKIADKSNFIKMIAKNNEDLTDSVLTNEYLHRLSFELSKMVKSYTKPQVSFKTTKLNEYNRQRLIYDSVEYKDVSIEFFDVKNNPVQQFFIAYLKFINGDFLCKNRNMWEKPIVNNQWMGSKEAVANSNALSNNYSEELNTFGFNIDTHFKLIDSISFCEYYMDRWLVYTIENPILMGIDWGSSEAGEYKSNNIKITFGYEGITNDILTNSKLKERNAINAEITEDIAHLMNIRYLKRDASNQPVERFSQKEAKVQINNDSEFSVIAEQMKQRDIVITKSYEGDVIRGGQDKPEISYSIVCPGQEVETVKDPNHMLLDTKEGIVTSMARSPNRIPTPPKTFTDDRNKVFVPQELANTEVNNAVNKVLGGTNMVARIQFENQDPKDTAAFVGEMFRDHPRTAFQFKFPKSFR